METVLPVRTPIYCKHELYSRDQSRSNSVFGLFMQRRASQSSYCTGCVRRTSFQVITCSGFPSRRQQKRSSRKLKGSNTREVMPQTLLDTDSGYRDAKYDRSPKNSKARFYSKTATPDKEILNREANSEESAEKLREVSAVEIVEFPSPDENHGVGNGSVGAVGKNVTEVHNGENDAEHSAKDESGWHEKYTTGNSSVIEISKQGSGDNIPEELEYGEGRRSPKRGKDEFLLRQKLKMEQIHKKELEAFAEEMFMEGNKFFVYPKVASAGDGIELFFHRAISTLNSEPDILVKGAFNDWRWRPFTITMNKSHLQGDWWSCHVTIPKQAYKMNFVFFNGKDIYDNNDIKDFCMPINCEMDASAFEEFLLKEKQEELEKLAIENAKRERKEEEKRQVEAEKAASEANRMKARVETEKKKEALQKSVEKAVPSLSNVWFIEPGDFEAKDLIRLYYNKNSGPLADANEIFIHGGYNNWQDGLSVVEKCTCSANKDQEWCYTDVVVPDRALVLDWVFADGPPQSAKVYDNNHLLDFHAIVPLCTPEEIYWMEEERNLFKRLEKERKLREDALRAKAKRTAAVKTESKRKSLRAYLWSQRHVMYAEPLNVRAGDLVTVFYNPANTVLKGKSDVWLRYSFNHWTHKNGLFPCQRMLPADNASYVKTTIKVPLDAYLMDFVFSEREDGGIFDNKNGMDYHIPVSGGLLKEPPMHIVHISVEMAPIAKVGGLGDVVTSLSRAVQDLNHNVEIILPKYNCLDHSSVNDFQFRRSFAWGNTEIKVWFGRVEGLPVYFLEPQNGFFSTGCIYGGKNDEQRFGFFCHAALEFLFQSGSNPDIIHCHDWSSAPVAWLYKEQHYMNNAQKKARVMFTIHNLEFGAHFIGKAMAYADMATTVSPTYSREVSGNPAIAPHAFKFHGVLNGIDPDIWDPYNDKYIPVSYTHENVVEGKRAAKGALQEKLGLRKSDLPLVGIVSRLTHQKGIHLIKHAIWRTLERGGQVVLLGAAPDHRIQNDFVTLSNELHSSHADRARLRLTYDEPLSHLIYAGADFILVPSIFEPCGLTQLIAMRYGSIPIVRKTGGLYDTVFDVENDKGRAEAHDVEPNGFNFDGADAGGIDYALNRAISMWYEKREEFEALCGEVMEQDWSWNRPALDYMELYHAIRK